MEGKVEDEDARRASPLDFPSAMEFGLDLGPENNEQFRTTHNQFDAALRGMQPNRGAGALPAQQEYFARNAISPPTIPRDTDIFFQRRTLAETFPLQTDNPLRGVSIGSMDNTPHYSSHSSIGSEDLSATNTFSSISRTGDTASSTIGTPFSGHSVSSFTRTIGSAFTSSGYSSSNTSSPDRSYHGRIGAYGMASSSYSNATSDNDSLVRPFSRGTTYREISNQARPFFTPVSADDEIVNRYSVSSTDETSNYTDSSRLQPLYTHPVALTSSRDSESSASTRGRDSMPISSQSRPASRGRGFGSTDRSRSRPPSVSGRGRSSTRKSQSNRKGHETSRSPRSGGNVSTPNICFPATESLDSRESPLPQNLRGDPFRSAKVKTELCRNFNTAKGCPFGDKCNYAHGEHELKFTKLMDLHRAGLIDLEIFRTHPCPTWVATGACPFDQRCMGLHDPRVKAEQYPAWLPHAETPANKVDCGVNVDKFYHERVAATYNACPLFGYVPIVREKDPGNFDNEASFADFYQLVCNLEDLRQNITDTNDGVDEETILELVTTLRQSREGASYSYVPSHMFKGELCMVLQKKYFMLRIINGKRHYESIPSPAASDLGDVEQDPLRGLFLITVREIAFGPVGDPTVPPVTMWFNLQEEELTKCTPQQAKHHNRSRHRLKKVINPFIAKGCAKKVKETQWRKSKYFYSYQPRDDDTNDLISDILRFRLKCLRHSRESPRMDHGIANSEKNILHAELSSLKKAYFALLRHWITWSWPDQMLQEEIDDDTDVPPVESRYEGRIEEEEGYQKTENILCPKRRECILTPTTKHCPTMIWRSFIINMHLLSHRPLNELMKNIGDLDDPTFSDTRRLPVLRDLSMGKTQLGQSPYSSLLQLKNAKAIEDLYEKWTGTKKHYKASYEKARKKINEKSGEDFSEDVKKRLKTLANGMTRGL